MTTLQQKTHKFNGLTADDLNRVRDVFYYACADVDAKVDLLHEGIGQSPARLAHGLLTSTTFLDNVFAYNRLHRLPESRTELVATLRQMKGAILEIARESMAKGALDNADNPANQKRVRNYVEQVMKETLRAVPTIAWRARPGRGGVTAKALNAMRECFYHQAGRVDDKGSDPAVVAHDVLTGSDIVSALIAHTDEDRIPLSKRAVVGALHEVKRQKLMALRTALVEHRRPITHPLERAEAVRLVTGSLETVIATAAGRPVAPCYSKMMVSGLAP